MEEKEIITTESEEKDMPEHVGPPDATRVPLLFVVDTAHALDSEVGEVMDKFRTIFENKLWLWEDFPMELPSLIRPDVPFITHKDLFPPPNFDELKQIATEPTGRGIPLSDEKLEEIRKRGEFRVQSANFPGQFHTWRLSLLLQKGNERGLKNLHKSLALSLEMIVIFARNRFDGKFISMKKSVHAFGRGIRLFVDMFFGSIHLETVPYSDKLVDEKFKYLLSDLTVVGEDEQEKMDLWIDYLERMNSGYAYDPQILPPIPHEYVTPRNLPISLVLYDSKVYNRIEERLIFLANTSIDRKMFMEFRQIVLNEINQITDNDHDKLQEIAENSLKQLLLPEYFEILKNDPVLSTISTCKVAELLLENYFCREIAGLELKSYAKSLDYEIENLENSLKNEYPIRSQIKRWMKRQRDKCRKNFHATHLWDVFDNIFEKVKAKGLNQFAYFFERYLHFEKEVEPIMINEFKSIKQPCRTFKIRRDESLDDF